MSTKKTFNILAIIVILSMIAAPASAQPTSVNVIDAGTLAPQAAPPEPEAASTSKWELVAVEATAIDMIEPAVYIVQLQDAPLPSYRGDIKGLAATNPAVRGESKLDANAPASLAYMDYLAQEQTQAIAEVNAALGRSLDVLYTYKAALNGFAAEMTAAEAAAVAKLPSVKHIEREHEYTLDTDAGPAWMGATGIWDGTETGVLSGTFGEGVIIGVIDTGIDPWNPSFLDIGGDSYDHTNPWGADTYVGVCDSSDPSYDATFPCNDKLIGAWGYTSVNDGDPRDANGHGSHTASTAGGNFVAGAVITTSTTDVYTANISGVAPHANIVMYAACCTGAALTAAKEQVILDGVDVVNYSIGYGGGTADLWTSIDTQTWLNVRDAGIFVANSAGNDGPDAATMGGPGDSPWMFTVGASSHDRRFKNALTNLISDTIPLADMEGEGMTGGYGPAAIVYAGTISPTNVGCDFAFAPGTFNGEIVVCDHNVDSPDYGGRVHKSEMVRDAGGGGFVMVTAEEYGIALLIDTYAVAGLGVTYTDGEMLKAGIASGAIQTATITGAVKDVDAAYGDIMAAFSSRGPIRSDYFIKPDVTAPGRAIWAAYHQGDGGDGTYTYNVIQGTSMSSPHAAGAAALLRALHPEWTMAQIQAAMMTTARNTVVDRDGTSTATAFEQGAGHIDLGPAAQAGFVLDVTTQEFTDANPATGGTPSALNLASLPNNQCIGTCSWTRVLSSTQDATVSWAASTDVFTDGITLTVTPVTFDLAAHATQIITVEADVSGLPNDVWAFGEVTFVATSVPTAHFPVAVKGSTGVLPSVMEIDAQRDAGSVVARNLKALDIVTMTVDSYGLAEATLTDFQLYEDPTNDIPEGFFDDLGQVFWTTMTVQATDLRLVAEIVDTTSPDLDMAVGRDLDGDGPEQDEIVCQSATGSAYEYCDVSGDDLVAGDWWVIVLNWEESANAPDDVTLATAIVPDTDSGNLTVTGPNSVLVNTPFDLRVFWDIPTMEVGDHWYGAFDIGTDPGNPGNVGTVPVNLVRAVDAVSKTVSAPVQPDGLATYTIVVQPNDTDEDITYYITDTLPAGVTYVPGSATNGATVLDGVLTWSGIMETPVGKVFDYDVSTSLDDALCAMPLAPYDGVADAYINLEAFGLLANPDVSGDGIAFAAGWDGGQFAFYGDPQSSMLYFTDDGYVSLDSASAVSGTIYPNADIPASGLPDALMAVLWNDMEIVYDEALNRGATTNVQLSSGGVPVMKLLEFDGVQLAGDANSQIDFEMAIAENIDHTPGEYEIIFAYNNITGAFNSLTVGSIGIENYDGTAGTKYAYNDAALQTLQDGMAICFDYESLEAVEISYQVVVSSALATGDTLVNHVCHDTDTPGTEEDCFDVSTTVQGPVPDWKKVILISDVPYGSEESPFTGIVTTDTIVIVDEVNVEYTDNITFTLTEEWDESLNLVSYDVVALPGGTTIITGSNVITENSKLTWTIADMSSDWGYVITKTFSIAEGLWTVDYITETLTVEGALEQDQLDDIVLEFQHMLTSIYLPLILRNS